jgi:hypothetical protein
MLPRHRARPVAAPVIDDDDLPGETEPVEVGVQFAQAASDGAFFVERWNND